jgi:thioredoxin reductase (NADPH)
MQTVKIYGADWCSMTKSSLAVLDHLKVPYEYINIDNDRESAAWVAAQSNGREKKPTIAIGSAILVEPTDDELENALRSAGVV